MEAQKRSKQKWDRLATTWVDTGPPASPSNEDIENFRNLLQDAIGDLSEGKIIILGSTPRLRDMLATHPRFQNFEVVCVDFSEEMYRRTTALVKHPNPNERFVLSDWLEFDIGFYEFHAVLGDKVIDNIMPQNWKAFFRRVHHHLRTNGSFIVHLAPQNMTFQYVTFAQSLHKWSEYHSRPEGSLERAAAGLWEECLGASAFYDGTRHNTQKTSRFLNEVESILAQIGSLDRSHREVFDEFIRVFWSSRDDEWSSYDYAEILAVMDEYFSHDKTVHSGDYSVATIQPIVRMKAK